MYSINDDGIKNGSLALLAGIVCVYSVRSTVDRICRIKRDGHVFTLPPCMDICSEVVKTQSRNSASGGIGHAAIDCNLAAFYRVRIEPRVAGHHVMITNHADSAPCSVDRPAKAASRPICQQATVHGLQAFDEYSVPNNPTCQAFNLDA